MEKFKLYKGDLSGECGNLRACGEESSDDVVSRWMQDDDPYEVEKVSLDPDDPASVQYYSLTGERIVLRRKVLGLPVDAAFELDANVLAAHPFVGSDCTVGELLDAKVRVAMAFVPLASDDGVSGAVLARLYCVSGIQREFPMPFDSEIPPRAKEYTWFLAGCLKSPRPVHESWHLAAGLLMSVLDDENALARRNLASSFIVTGLLNWSTGEVGKVGMGQKTSVVTPELRQMTWIMPADNRKGLKEEAENMINRIECPATLEKAYELIQTMQNEATTALLALLDKPNYTAFVSQLKNGADIQAVRKDLNVRPLQAITMQIEKVATELGKVEDEKDPFAVDLRNRLLDLRKMKARLYRDGAGAAFLFWNYAKAGRRDMIEELAKDYDVNSCDECGDSAIDMAIDAGDKNAEEILRSFGVHAGPYHRVSPDVKSALAAFGKGKFSDSHEHILLHALDAGLPPETQVVVNDIDVDDDGSPFGGIFTATLFEAVISRGRHRMIERCIELGADVNVQRVSAGTDYLDRNIERHWIPLQWAPSESVKELLMKHGAHWLANGTGGVTEIIDGE